MAAKSTLYMPSALMSAVAANIYFSVSPGFTVSVLDSTTGVPPLTA